MVDQLDKFKNDLQEKGLRVTQSRIAVFTVLEKNRNAFLSSDEVYDLIHGTTEYTCDRASVYRVLNTLEEINLVRVTQFQGEANKYQIHHHTADCGNCGDHHEHYFKCIKCESVKPIGDCFIDDKIKELEEKGFKALGHHLEITGRCPKCN